ncbi:MAG: hypothetical protein KAW56_12505, partial [Candidatus Marinimicrobia bacterium]|nr:hypothetical protein [Candidatus Neomarinimicrobiota bacterium]
MKKFMLLIAVCFVLLGSCNAENIIVNPSFEDQAPAFWSPLNGTIGTDLDVESTEVFAGYHSLKITKSSTTSDVVGWESDNNANLYWNHAGQSDAGFVGNYALSAMVKTVGVNTSPGEVADLKIGLVYYFQNASGVDLVDPVYLWADQSAASVDWDTLKGIAILSDEPTSIVVKAVMGKEATGTVYIDNVGCGTDPWSMGIFNGDIETVDSWMKWFAASEGCYAKVTDSEAHTGSYSVELYKPAGTSNEIVYYSIPGAAEAGEWYKIGVWVKTEGVNDSTAYVPTYIMTEGIAERINLCYFFHKGNINTEWSPLGGDKFVHIDQRDDSTGWTHYVVIEQAPEEATGISVRARFNHSPSGKAWFDDFSVEKIVVSGDNMISNSDFEDQAPAF